MFSIEKKETSELTKKTAGVDGINQKKERGEEKKKTE
jgi:hypothetical protein